MMEVAAGGGGGGAGPGPDPGPGELDLSLDDIIKRNKKGPRKAKATGNRWKQPFKHRNPAYSSSRRPGFRSWAPRRDLPGPFRFRGGFRKQQYYRRNPFWNGVAGPRQRAVVGPNGVSPLNRPMASRQGQQDGSDGAAASTQPALPPKAKQFRNAGVSPPNQRPFRLNRRPAFLQTPSRFRFRGRQMESNADRKPPWMRRWQPQLSSGAVLTISLSNPQASQTNMPGAKRPFLRRRNTAAKMTQAQPKGVPLRFNFRAMANQTSLTLNERFSGLRHKYHFTPVRHAGRTVTLP